MICHCQGVMVKQQSQPGLFFYINYNYFLVSFALGFPKKFKLELSCEQDMTPMFTRKIFYNYEIVYL